MELVIGNSAALISKSQAIRNQVFVIEQGIPLDLDLDGLDEQSYHALVTDNNSFVATARLTIVEDKNAVMARVAVLKEYRGSGIATKLINALLSYAREINIDSIEIHAHEYLRGYYENFGFKYIKKAEVVGEHQLIEMHYKVESK
jgi:predicted GNAT family N-acyltransferase